MGFLANLIAKFKSVYILRHSIAVPARIGFNSLRIALIYCYSYMASFIAMYSASQELNAIVLCNFEFQEIGVPLYRKM